MNTTLNPTALHIPEIWAALGVTSFTYEPGVDYNEYKLMLSEGRGEICRVATDIDPIEVRRSLLLDMTRTLVRRHHDGGSKRTDQ